jgi:hypothetical protein
MRSEKRVGLMASQSGQAVARVNHSQLPVAAVASMTRDTSGRGGLSSSKPIVLQSSLESRLQVRTALRGSTLFALTWKERVTPSGRRICALRASVLRTSGNACTSWPSPAVNDAKGSAYSYAQGDHNRLSLKLVGAARLASWPTPAATNADRGGDARRFKGSQSLGGRRSNLQDAVMISPWATPSARDWRDGRASQATMERNSRPLNEQAVQLLASGKTSSGSLAKTAKPGQLNPAFSRWLMGLPPEWDACAPTAMPSLRTSQRPSSKP